MSAYTQNLLRTLAFSLAIAFSVSACSSTLAPEDDSATEYVFEADTESPVLAKDSKDINWDNSDD